MQRTSFGERLRTYRKARDLTQAELAELVGCAAESIRKMEANRQRPSKQFAQRLADLLALSSDEREDFIRLARLRHDEGAPPFAAALDASGSTEAGPLGPAELDPLAPPAPALTAGHEPLAHPAPATLLSSMRGVPIRFHSLVGRKQALAAIAQLLQRPDVGMVTLTGPGGVGKTRLAIHVANELAHEFPDGISFVSLTAISDPALVATTIAQALRLREPDAPLLNEHLKSYLCDKRLLLILDNFEHVIAATSIVAELRNVAPGLRLLVTSRARLHLYGELEYVVPPLSLPNLKRLPDPQALLAYESIQLFLDRARLINPDFALTEANARAVAELCCRLDGLPLAIELAAARIKLLSPQMMLARMGRLALLTGGAHDLPVRHQTLRAAIAWSYELLSPREQALFRRISAFAGSWSLDAAEAICRDEGSAPAEREPIPAEEVLELIGALIDQSLLHHVDSLPGDSESEERRFAMMETIREFALDQLEQAGELAELRRRHLDYYVALAEHAVPHLAGPQQGAWLARLEQDYDNLRAALQWVVAQREGQIALRLCEALLHFWYVFGQAGELRQWVEAVLQMELAPEARAHQLHGYVLAFMQSDYAAAEQAYRRALDLWRQQEAPLAVADTLSSLGIVTMERGDYASAAALHEEALAVQLPPGSPDRATDVLLRLGIVLLREGQLERAQSIFEQSLERAQASDDQRAVAVDLHYLGVTAFYQGQHVRARQLLDQALELWRDAGDARGVSAALNALGPVALAQGDSAEALSTLRRSLSMRWEWQDRDGCAWGFERLAEVASQQGDDLRAARLWGAAEALRARIGLPLPPVERDRLLPSQQRSQARLGEPAWRAALVAGHTLSWSQAVAFALRAG